MMNLDLFRRKSQAAGRKVYKFLPPITPREFSAYLHGPRVLASCFPKAGTHLLKQILSLLPLLVSRWTYHLSEEPSLLSKLSAVRNGQYLTGHLPWTSEILAVLKDKNIRTLLIIRDLRDIAVSNAYYITYIDHSHRLSPYFNSLSSDSERLMASIVGIDGQLLADGRRSKSLGEHAARFEPWFREPICLTVRFEDLIGSLGGGSDRRQLETVQAITTHLGLDLSEDQLAQVASRAFSRSAPTFRKGQIGDWRNHFTEAHKRAFKETSGEMLIKWGYADGYDW